MYRSINRSLLSVARHEPCKALFPIRGDLSGSEWRMRILWTIVIFVVAPAAHAQTPYDGIWKVTIRTSAGSCEPTANNAVTVTDGRGSGPPNVSGTVGRTGNVRASIGAAYASGQLDAAAGASKWSGASGGVPCSGRWEASKQ
jgi:hypothetical protein